MNQFNRFVDIEHAPLRIYNRTVMFYNIYEDSGRAAAEDYANSFNAEERLEMAKMAAEVKAKGTKAVKEAVTKGLVFTDYPVETVQ